MQESAPFFQKISGGACPCVAQKSTDFHCKKVGRYAHTPHFILRSVQRWPTGRLVTILVVKKNPVLNTSSTIYRTCIYRCCSNLANRLGIITYINLSLFFEIRSKMDAWWPFCSLNISPTIYWTCMVRFCLNVAESQYTTAYTCTQLYFAI